MKRKWVALFGIITVASALFVTAAMAGSPKGGPLSENLDTILSLEERIENLTELHRNDIDNLQNQINAIISRAQPIGYLNIPASAFRLDNYEITTPQLAPSQITNIIGEDYWAFFSAPVLLPTNVTVTNLTICATDNEIGDGILQSTIVHLSKRNATSAYVMATVLSADGNFTMNFDDSITNHDTIDNINETYWLFVQLPPETPEILFHYAVITYEYTT